MAPATAASTALRRTIFTGGRSSEPRIEIDLPDIETIARRTIDLVGTHVPQAQPGVLHEAKRSPHVVTGRIRASLVEIRVGPGIDHGVALHVAITYRRTQPRELIDDRIAETDLTDITLVLWVAPRLIRQRLDL